MHLVLFSIVAICIAAINAQLPVLPPVAVVPVGTESSTASASTTAKPAATTAKTATTKAKATGPATSTAAGTSTAKADSSESGEDKDKDKAYNHEHDTHHEHDATISVDVHNILDLFKHELHELEERIVAAIHHSHEDHNSTAAPIVKSYRTASR